MKEASEENENDKSFKKQVLGENTKKMAYVWFLRRQMKGSHESLGA